MAQPVSAYQWVRIAGTATGTVTLMAEPCVLHAFFIGSNNTGTVTFYDSASGTTATKMSALNNNSGSVPFGILIDAQLKTGLTYVTGGTTDMTVMYG